MADEPATNVVQALRRVMDDMPAIGKDSTSTASQAAFAAAPEGFAMRPMTACAVCTGSPSVSPLLQVQVLPRLKAISSSVARSRSTRRPVRAAPSASRKASSWCKRSETIATCRTSRPAR